MISLDVSTVQNWLKAELKAASLDESAAQERFAATGRIPRFESLNSRKRDPDEAMRALYSAFLLARAKRETIFDLLLRSEDALTRREVST